MDDDPNVAVLVDAMGATLRWQATLHLLAWEREQRRLVEGQRLLDVGCGLGEAAIELSADLAAAIDASDFAMEVERTTLGLHLTARRP